MTNTAPQRPRALPRGPAPLLPDRRRPRPCLSAVLAQDSSPVAPDSARLPMQPGDIHAVQLLAGDETVYKLDVEQVGRYRLTTGLLPAAQQVQVNGIRRRRRSALRQPVHPH